MQTGVPEIGQERRMEDIPEQFQVILLSFFQVKTDGILNGILIIHLLKTLLENFYQAI